MDTQPPAKTFVFPRWTVAIRPLLAVVLLGGPVYLLTLAYYGGAPRSLNTGYAPVQPVAYSHALHAGKLGLDCRYCHTSVEKAAFASLPPTQTCMNCHTKVRANSDKLALVRESYATGRPIRWVKVHDLPDYVFFNHSAHVSRGVGCVECHGRVDRMEVVTQVQTLSMAWCLGCHRDPDAALRPPEMVTQMDWKPAEEKAALGRRLRQQYGINPSQDCTTCHR